MKDIDLLAIVLKLRPLIEKPRKAANWYGRAAQALLYACVNAYDPALGSWLHGSASEDKPFSAGGNFPGGRVLEVQHGSANEDKPFSASTLIGSFAGGKLHPHKEYYLRVCGLNPALEDILYRAIQPGGHFGVGTVIDMDQVPFLIEDVFWKQSDHWLARFSSYGLLRDHFFQTKAGEYGRMRIDFQKCPLIAQQTNGSFNPLITPAFIFESLTRKWNSHAPQAVTGDLGAFLQEETYISAFEMRSQPVQMEGLVMGAKGFIELSSRALEAPEWSALMMLAAFGFYSGVGKNTTRGFGQITAEFKK
jgi:CRISPR-associated endoribonuclease Cas6